MKYLTCFIALFFSGYCISQTCIIVNKTKDAIFVGADSRGAAFETVADHMPTILCKIGSVGKFNFTISGVGFPMALQECKKACKAKTTFEEVIESFAPVFIQKLQDSLEIVRQLMPKLFIELTYGKQEISSIVFFGRQGDSLFLAKTSFICKPDTTIPVIITGTGGKYENKPVIIAMGKTDEIKDTIFAKGTWNKGIVLTIKNLIKIEIKAHPTKVSEPIDILKVTMKGNTWIQRKKICTNLN